MMGGMPEPECPNDCYEQDLAVLTEMAACSKDEAGRRAVHLAAELMAHQRDGGRIELVGPRRTLWRPAWRERLIFKF